MSQLGIFLGVFGGGFIILAIISALLMVGTNITPASAGSFDWSKPGVLTMMKWLQAFSSLILFLLPAIVFALIVFRDKPLYFLGLRPEPKKQMYLLAALVVLLAFPFVMWLGQINEAIPLPKWMTGLEGEAQKQMEAFLKADNAWQVAVNVGLIALLPAICEELCFRGALQRVLIHLTKSPWAGIILTGFLFSALHMQFQGFLPRMFLGVILGALYWYSGSLWTSILAHFVTNAVQVVAVSYAPEYITKNPQVNIFMALISAACVFGLLWTYRSWSKVSYEKVYEPDQLNRTNEFIA